MADRDDDPQSAPPGGARITANIRGPAGKRLSEVHVQAVEHLLGGKTSIKTATVSTYGNGLHVRQRP